MMAKDPAQRYPTPERTARAIRAFLFSEDQSPRPTAPEERSPEYMRWLETSAERTPAAADMMRAEPSAVAEPARTPAAMSSATRAEDASYLNRRDAIMMALGAAGVLLAEGAGWLIARMLRRKSGE
jgi:hypothetical protein